MKKKKIFSGSNPCKACETCEAWVLLGTTLRQVGGVRVDMEYHVTGMKPDDCIEVVCSTVSS
jgi:hypothetical protein